jgi:arsenate reductase-like glutaredoxin family protein
VEAKTFDWRYHRSGCSTCQKAEDFLSKHKLAAREIVEAKKSTLKAADALKLAHSVDEIFATKGTKHVHFNLNSDKPSDDELLAVMLGPTGNMRAPTLRKGRRLLVGYNESSYKEVLLN